MTKLYEIIQIIVLSVLIIVLMHYFFVFLKSNLTLPKLKDLLDNPRERYENMYKIINHEKDIGIGKILEENNNNDTTSINDLPEQNMKDELKNFLNEMNK
tara:strand:+ start:8977 stop:9276 length:300 start_codon:yes stop_codon:yes gene_type:complete